MDITEKRKQYYNDNKERIKASNKKYYHDNKAQRQIYNRDYWAIHGHKYIKQRSEDSIYKANQRIYYEKYYEKYKEKKNLYVRIIGLRQHKMIQLLYSRFLFKTYKY